MRQIQPRRNYLGAVGWLWAGNYKLERYLYILHRITGLGILLFLLLHLMMTTVFRIQGQGVWETTMSILHNPWFKIGEYLVVIAFVYHALNGLRLILQELGFLMGRPIPPIYPYRDSLRKKRPWTIAMIAVVVILALVFFYDFVAGGW
ncbi:MAG: succinate dehydrogenase, cytochrome b556 subunit [Chloroflexi bacterium]|jgi:succinate dehydrogenase / fumarate reductase cytochrome b subunit|nr:succinate dehydrogenase, cytochrome b556 subunit [Chloroflexota bacterium]